MNVIAKWIIESVVATVVVVVCIGIPRALDLPSATLALSVIPIVLYLSWRLDTHAFAWRSVAVFATILGTLILVQHEFLPESWRDWSPYLVVVIAVSLGSLLKQKQIQPHGTT